MPHERLNLGCGVHYAEGWTNVDLYEDDLVGDGRRPPDVIGDARALPFKDSSAELVYMGHVLEHMPERDVLKALREVARVLCPRGTLMIVVPDIKKAKAQGEWSIVESIETMPGPDDLRGLAHEWFPTEKRVLELAWRIFPRAEAVDIRSVEDIWPLCSRATWQSAVRCPA